MSELIGRLKTIEILTSMMRDCFPEAEEELDAVVTTVKEIPSIESKRKKGKWQRRKKSDCWECSQCHAVLENNDLANHNFYFCYHCGANMKDKIGYMDIEKANYE